jgi:hypothetical protein
VKLDRDNLKKVFVIDAEQKKQYEEQYKALEYWKKSVEVGDYITSSIIITRIVPNVTIPIFGKVIKDYEAFIKVETYWPGYTDPLSVIIPRAFIDCKINENIFAEVQKTDYILDPGSDAAIRMYELMKFYSNPHYCVDYKGNGM